MKRARAEKWEEAHRQAVGFTTDRGDKHALPWFCLVYRITEARKERGQIVAYRERLVYGKPVNGAMVPEPAFHALLRAVVDGAEVLKKYAETEDDLATSRRKAR